MLYRQGGGDGETCRDDHRRHKCHELLRHVVEERIGAYHNILQKYCIRSPLDILAMVHALRRQAQAYAQLKEQIVELPPYIHGKDVSHKVTQYQVDRHQYDGTTYEYLAHLVFFRALMALVMSGLVARVFGARNASLVVAGAGLGAGMGLAAGAVLGVAVLALGAAAFAAFGGLGDAVLTLGIIDYDLVKTNILSRQTLLLRPLL